MKKISILGSTGSIGTQTLDVIREHGDMQVVALSCGRNLSLIEKQARERDYTICPCMRGLSCVRATLRAGTRRVAIHT